MKVFYLRLQWQALCMQECPAKVYQNLTFPLLIPVPPSEKGSSLLVPAGPVSHRPSHDQKTQILPIAPVPKPRINVPRLLVNIDPPYWKD